MELTSLVVAVGGTAGYIRTRSTPSLVAGLVLGASCGYAGAKLSVYIPGCYADSVNRL